MVPSFPSLSGRPKDIYSVERGPDFEDRGLAIGGEKGLDCSPP